MARHEQDREDILAEATALVQRLEIRTAIDDEPIIAGVRRDGCLSLYFGAEPAYHFNTQGELRRAYADGLLYKAEGGRLIALQRVRSDQEVQLQRRELTSDEQAAWLAALQARITLLLTAVDHHRIEVLRQVPEGAPLLCALRTWLTALPAQLVVARLPHAQ